MEGTEIQDLNFEQQLPDTGTAEGRHRQMEQGHQDTVRTRLQVPQSPVRWL